jgi:hypothetical protein
LKRLLTLFAASLLTPLAAFSAAAPAKQPNIVFICADDSNFDSVGCYGVKIPDLTPNLGRPTGEGIPRPPTSSRSCNAPAMPSAEALAHRNDRAVYLSARERVNAEFNKPAPKKKASIAQ